MQIKWILSSYRGRYLIYELNFLVWYDEGVISCIKCTISGLNRYSNLICAVHSDHVIPVKDWQPTGSLDFDAFRQYILEIAFDILELSSKNINLKQVCSIICSCFLIELNPFL